MCRDHGAKVMAMTCMESAFCAQEQGQTPANKERLRINGLIREYVHRADGLNAIALVDLGESFGSAEDVAVDVDEDVDEYFAADPHDLDEPVA
eukprot:gene24576-10187_t